ncbi:MAG: hypothetical protein R3B84_14990 [Zavarzinella sp.]
MKVDRSLDIIARAGKPWKTITREYRGIRIQQELEISFRKLTPRGATLAGLEVIAEE